MRITFILPCYPWRPIGAFRVVYEYANQLVTRDHLVTVVHARHVRYEEDFWAPHGIYRRLRSKVGQMRDVMFKPSISWFKLDKRVQSLFVPEPTAAFIPNADAVIAGAWGVAPYLLRYPMAKGEKFHLLQHYAVTFGLPKPWVDSIWKAPLHTIVIAGWLAEIAKELGIRNVPVIPNGINLSLFRLTRPVEQRPKRIAMLFSSRDWKGPADGLQALATAKQAHPDLQAVFFGIPPRPTEVPAWIEYYQDPTQDRLVQDIYNSSSIYLCPSWREGFPLPPLEGMACGCALVTTACGGVLEYAEHSRNALVSPPRNPELLAQNLCRVLDDDALRLRLAQAGLECAGEFSWERSTARLEKFIKDPIPFAREHFQSADGVSLEQGSFNYVNT